MNEAIPPIIPVPPIISEVESQYKDIEEAKMAVRRLLINLGIVGIELIPVVGNVGSVMADSIKFARFARIAHKFTPKKLIEFLPDKLVEKVEHSDPTPEVGLKMALFIELCDAFSCGSSPTHGFETLLQLKRGDWEKIKAGYQAMKRMREDEKKDYGKNKPTIDEAIATFENDKPDDKKHG